MKSDKTDKNFLDLINDDSTGTVLDTVSTKVGSNLKHCRKEKSLMSSVCEENPKLKGFKEDIIKRDLNNTCRDVTKEQDFYKNKVKFKKQEFQHFVDLGKMQSYADFVNPLS